MDLSVLAGPPLKLSERVGRPSPVSSAAIEQLLGSLNLGVQKGLDPDADNLVAAGTFAYGSMQNPMKVGQLASSEAPYCPSHLFHLMLEANEILFI